MSINEAAELETIDRAIEAFQLAVLDAELSLGTDAIFGIGTQSDTSSTDPAETLRAFKEDARALRARAAVLARTRFDRNVLE